MRFGGLNLYLRLSHLLFDYKRKFKKKNSVKRFWWAGKIVLLELFLIIVFLPLFLIFSPKKIKWGDFVFPRGFGKKKNIKNYIFRRRAGLTAFFGVIGIFAIKILFTGVISFFLLGGHSVLAATQSWNFDTPGNYTYDSAKIEITGGVARLKSTDSVQSGNTTNSGFDTDSSGWTFVGTWSQPGGTSNAGAHSASGGNPGGYINITLDGKKSNTFAAYWYQAFTTTVNNPDTATLDLDWIISAFDAAGLSSYHIYAFVDTTSGNPSLGTEVWDSGNITGTTSWASISQIDISSKVPTAGIYYVKVAAYAVYAAVAANGGQISGFDNAVVNWSKTTTGYATDRPTINPTTSLSPGDIASWDSFTEVATKNGGEIYYQLSDDDGATWQYWNGSSWASAGASNYNIASVINTNISSFSVANDKIIWKAFLESNGTQQVTLDSVSINYTIATPNTAPSVSSVSASQRTDGGKLVDIDYTLTDAESDGLSLAAYEYSLTGDFTGEEAAMTPASGDPSHDGISGLSSSAGGVGHTFVWDAGTDLAGTEDSSVYVRIRANDGSLNSNYTNSSAFALDASAPSGLSSFSKFSSTPTQATVQWSSGISDNNFNHYEIWHGANQSDVVNRTGTAQEWDQNDDANLNTISTTQTVVTGISITGNYYMKIWAIDNYGNEATLSEINVYEAPGNDTPSILGLSASQRTNGSGLVDISYSMQDDESEASTLVAYEYSLTGAFSGEEASLTPATGDPSHDGVLNLSSSAGGVGHTFVWNAGADLINIEDASVYVRLRANDGTENGDYATSPAFDVDTKAPSGLVALVKSSGTANQVTLNWYNAATDNNFSHYEIWHGANQSDVVNRTGTAQEWDNTDDPNLTTASTVSTIITGLSVTASYYMKIWAIDDFGSEQTVNSINVYEAGDVVTDTPDDGTVIISKHLLPQKPVLPNKPTLNTVSSPTELTQIVISGFAEPTNSIDLYNNKDELLFRLDSPTDAFGKFKQTIVFKEGRYTLKAKAVDSDGDVSEFSDSISFIIDISAPNAPVVLSHENNESIINRTPLLFGTAEPLTDLEIIFNENKFDKKIDNSGTWSFAIPEELTLSDGVHIFEFKLTDIMGHESKTTILKLNVITPAPIEPKIIEPIAPAEPEAPKGIVESIISKFTPKPKPEFKPDTPQIEVEPEVLDVLEIPSLPAPKISKIESPANNIFSFNGSSLPNEDIIVYINSEKTLLYRTKSNSEGLWDIHHSQEIIELAPGEHSIFAISINEKAKVKSSPSPIEIFTIKKNYWVLALSYINFQTTILAIVVLLFSVLFIYRARRPKPAQNPVQINQ
ncbi:hypothetical protein ACFL29_00150 [Patescibacteria group bacterium]